MSGGKVGLTKQAAGLTTVSGTVEVDTTTPLDVLDGWRVLTISDEDLNDSDKTFAVPAGVERHILWIWVEYTADATVGDRQLVIEAQDSASDVIAQWARAGIVQAAGTTYYYQFGPGLPDDVALRDSNYLRTPIPTSTLLKALDILRVYDNNAVSAAGDDMQVHIQYADSNV